MPGAGSGRRWSRFEGQRSVVHAHHGTPSRVRDPSRWRWAPSRTRQRSLDAPPARTRIGRPSRAPCSAWPSRPPAAGRARCRCASTSAPHPCAAPHPGRGGQRGGRRGPRCRRSSSVAAAIGLDLFFLRPYGTVSILTIEDSVALGLVPRRGHHGRRADLRPARPAPGGRGARARAGDPGPRAGGPRPGAGAARGAGPPRPTTSPASTTSAARCCARCPTTCARRCR